MIDSALFLQVRLDSSRLPGKALLLLEGKTVTAHVMEALKNIKTEYHVLLTTEDSKEELLPIAEEGGFELYVGSKEDVLDRYYQASRHYGISRIVRATGDNPLVSASLANQAIDLQSKVKSDYTGFLGMPIGTGVEVVTTEALGRAWRESKLPRHREHVLPYLYENPSMFKIYRPIVEKSLRAWDYRVTLDTKEDYSRLQSIYREIYTGKPIELKDLVQWIQSTSSYPA